MTRCCILALLVGFTMMCVVMVIQSLHFDSMAITIMVLIACSISAAVAYFVSWLLSGAGR